MANNEPETNWEHNGLVESFLGNPLFLIYNFCVSYPYPSLLLLSYF
jgi:hypothetical protein